MNMMKTDSMRARAALLGVMLLAALAMGLCLAQPAWADEDSSDETYEVTVTGTYHQSDAYSMLAMINKFRTAEVDENDGNTPWAWNETDTKKVHYDGLKELKWSSDLEEIAMQRAAEIALRYSHTRPNGESCFTTKSSSDKSSFGENLAQGKDYEADVILGLDKEYYDCSAAFKDWREDDCFYSSPNYGQGHRRAMLGNYAAVGIACFKLNGVCYWAMELGSGGDDAASHKDSVSKVSVSVVKSYLDSIPLDFEDLSSSIKLGSFKNVNESITVKITNLFYGSLDDCPTFSAPLKTWKIKSGSDAVELDESSVTGLKAGTAVLTNTALGKEVTCAITVKDKAIPSITNIDESKIVKLSDSLTFSPKCDSDAKPSFKSSNESVAYVDNNGKVTLKKMGYADITVSYAEAYDYEAASKTCKLTVVDDATNVPTDGKGEVQIYIPGQNNANVTVTPAATVSAPAKTSISKLVKAKKAFTVKWKKKSGVAGYQVRYSLKSSMKGSKTVKVKSAKTVSKKVKKLKKKKKYYVQVRTYKVVNGKTYWSGWSAKKSVKTK